jgi:histidinol-phosphate phosphatase family protein
MNEPERLKPAIFWDRDGTLIEDRGHLADVRDAVLFPNTIPALRRLQPYFSFFIVTNQSGVAQGKISIEDVERVNRHVVSQLTEAGLTISAVYVCPHSRSDGCRCIKPNPYFLHEAARDFHISLPQSFVVGDHPQDVELAEQAGARGIYVCTGHGMKHFGELAKETIVVPDIEAAADWILLWHASILHGGSCDEP